MQNMSSDRVCASRVYQVCMCNAWTSTHEAKCVKHTTNDQNMYKYGKPQNLVLIGVQKSEKNTVEAFDQTPRMHTLYTYDEQCMNMWKTCLNTC